MIPVPQIATPQNCRSERLRTEAEAVWVEQALDRLPTLIAQLPMAERDLVIQHYFDGRALPEIEAELGLGRETGQSLLRCALTKLKEELQQG